MQEKIAAVVVENTFTSVLDMIDVVMPFLKWAKFLVRNPWKSIDIVKDIKIPFLFISSSQDELVPAHMMKTLYENSTSPNKNLIEFPTGHMDAWTHPTYFDSLKTWLDEKVKE